LAPVDLYLDSNEGRPPAPAAIAAMIADCAEPVSRYPSTTRLEAMLAARVGLEPAQVVVTNGGDNALDCICRVFLDKGREMVLPVPTFQMLSKFAAGAGGSVVEVQWAPGQLFPVDAVVCAVSERTSVIMVVSPNNPTGAIATIEDVRRLSVAAPGALVVLDAAYSEFCDDGLVSEALKLPNVIVVQTFSKARGMAGLRVGYAMGPQRLIEFLRPAVGPYPVSGLSLGIAASSLESAQGQVDAFVERVLAERDLLSQLLNSSGFVVYPSEANFVFARSQRRVLDGTDLWLRHGLAGLGISVRGFPGIQGIDDCVRITCPGDEADFARLIEAINSVMQPQAMLFDMDGVLADDSRSYQQAIIQTACSFLREQQIADDVTDADVDAVRSLGNANNDWVLCTRILAGRGVDVPLDVVTDRFEKIYQGVEGTPGLRELELLNVDRNWLRMLSGRMPLGIVTGRPRADAMYFLDKMQIRDLFGAIVCMEDGPLKPDAAPIKLALEKLGVARAWMIGDTPDDVTAARAAGVVPIGFLAPAVVNDARISTLLTAGAAVVIQDLTKLEDILP
jgi:histidinol-phosphate aminotransferase